MSHDIAERMANIVCEIWNSFDASQREVAYRKFHDDDERKLWFFTPTDHGGLSLSLMNARQQRLVNALVACGLSRAGYNTVAAIMGLENILDRVEDFRVNFGRERGRDPQLYYLTVFGDPRGRTPWAWRFGGHHVSLHYCIVDGRVEALTPSFLGADPADSALLGPHLHRPLAAAEDLGRELFRSLNDRSTEALISPVAPVDIATGNRPYASPGDRPMGLPDVWRNRFDGELGQLLETMQSNAEVQLGLTQAHIDAVSFTDEPKGVSVVTFSDAQRSVFDELMLAYLGRLPEELADEQLALVEQERSCLKFAWAGGAERYEPHYYRIQGERILIEYDNTQRGANHIHTVWRDLKNDFGGDVLARHYAESSHR